MFLNDHYKSVFVVEPLEVDLPVFISKLTNFFGVEKTSLLYKRGYYLKKLLDLNSHKACGVDSCGI